MLVPSESYSQFGHQSSSRHAHGKRDYSKCHSLHIHRICSTLQEGPQQMGSKPSPLTCSDSFTRPMLKRVELIWLTSRGNSGQICSNGISGLLANGIVVFMCGHPLIRFQVDQDKGAAWRNDGWPRRGCHAPRPGHKQHKVDQDKGAATTGSKLSPLACSDSQDLLDY